MGRGMAMSQAVTRRLADADIARVVQFSDTHLSHRQGVPDSVRSLIAHVDNDPPDLLVVTGDVVQEDPDDDDDRAFAHDVLTGVPCPVLAIPGNHDIGFYGDDDARAHRIAAFVDTWGADRFSVDVAGWRLVGANAYLLGELTHDTWLGHAVGADSPVAVFIHQPLAGDPDDGWAMPQLARDAFARATDGADIRLISSGHRHRSVVRGPVVWAPSTTIVGDMFPDGTDPALGAAQLTFRRNEPTEVTFLRP